MLGFAQILLFIVLKHQGDRFQGRKQHLLDIFLFSERKPNRLLWRLKLQIDLCLWSHTGRESRGGHRGPEAGLA